MDKLRNFPHVYYFNVNHYIERKKYMESQFQSMGWDYTRVSMQKPKDNNLFEWYWNNLIGTYSKNTSHYINLYSAEIFKFLSQWIQESNDDYLIIMEDDYDVSLAKYWHFEWEDLLERLPYDWDCIQLGFETSSIISFYLHPTKSEYSLGPSLLNREYVKKLLSLHYPNSKFKFDYTIANAIYIDRDSGIHDGLTYSGTSGSPDYFISQSGCSYSLPLIPINPYFTGISHSGAFKKYSWHPKLSFVKCYEAYYDWWINDRDNFTLDEFFTYGKSNDCLMERDISRWEDKYFYDLAMKYNENLFISTTA